MKLSSVLMAVVLTLAACQMTPEKPTPPTASVQLTREQLKIREAQTGLKKLGYYRSRVDGITGPRTASAVRRSRADFGLAPTGAIDSEFMDIMNRYIDLNPPQKGIPSAANTFAIQRGLKRLGYYNGQVNGLYDSATLAAVLDYKRKSGLPINAKVDTKLVSRIDSDAVPG
jgi:peptidoglycan hydrolase-like protein with peptidoglycan-binding domain